MPLLGPAAAAVVTLAIGLCVLPEICVGSTVSWVGPADCDQRDQLLFQVERALGAPLSEVETLHFEVHVERTRPDAQARLLVQTSADAQASERVLMAPDCSTLASTLAVAMALAVAAADPSPAPESAGGAGGPGVASAATLERSAPSAEEPERTTPGPSDEARRPVGQQSSAGSSRARWPARRRCPTG